MTYHPECENCYELARGDFGPDATPPCNDHKDDRQCIHCDGPRQTYPESGAHDTSCQCCTCYGATHTYQ